MFWLGVLVTCSLLAAGLPIWLALVVSFGIGAMSSILLERARR
jgi:hypothetical protein